MRSVFVRRRRQLHCHVHRHINPHWWKWLSRWTVQRWMAQAPRLLCLCCCRILTELEIAAAMLGQVEISQETRRYMRLGMKCRQCRRIRALIVMLLPLCWTFRMVEMEIPPQML